MKPKLNLTEHFIKQLLLRTSPNTSADYVNQLVEKMSIAKKIPAQSQKGTTVLGNPWKKFPVLSKNDKKN
ncbi:MAG: hypothetical protein AAB071_03855 [Bacteroidota bacterium]